LNPTVQGGEFAWCGVVKSLVKEIGRKK